MKIRSAFPIHPLKNLTISFDSFTSGMSGVVSEVSLIDHSMLGCMMTTYSLWPIG